MTTMPLSSKTVTRKKVWAPSCNFYPRDSIRKAGWSKQNHVIRNKGTTLFYVSFLSRKQSFFSKKNLKQYSILQSYLQLEYLQQKN